MPDSYGKRQRAMQKARKSAARDERRAARKQQRADEAAGLTAPEPWLASAEPPEAEVPTSENEALDGSDGGE